MPSFCLRLFIHVRDFCGISSSQNMLIHYSQTKLIFFKLVVYPSILNVKFFVRRNRCLLWKSTMGPATKYSESIYFPRTKLKVIDASTQIWLPRHMLHKFKSTKFLLDSLSSLFHSQLEVGKYQQTREMNDIIVC